MSDLKRHAANSLKSLAWTSLFCTVIAFTTQTIWPSSLWEHLAISFGYGYSAVISAHLIAWLKPNFSLREINIYSLLVAMVLGSGNAYFWLNKYEKFSHIGSMKPVVFLGFVFTVACFFYFYAHEQKLQAQKALEVAKRKQSEQEKALILSQLKQLQSQIEPHFLFNTLANINALISSEPKSAQMMLERLTDLLRGTLQSSRQKHTNLQGELDLVDAYLSIQKIRLGNRLNFTIDNQVEHGVTLPPLILQPLVENALQHGIEPKEQGGQITIRAFVEEDDTVIEVLDTGVGLTAGAQHTGHGIGLDNIRQRLLGLFGEFASLTIAEHVEGGVKATLRFATRSLDGIEEVLDER
ncbi:sensor histidine kinase [Vibrio paucivorans]|uniref:Histidine kinase n=1 Tax=Vibrio paucivorans TaxID=2829489 RepID=A0A9X3HNX2_9VIBR|nr:histidine kinase [Vibrio paucivorans]MCW8332366.1 histidine kinase [Vibrio paucivorans]